MKLQIRVCIVALVTLVAGCTIFGDAGGIFFSKDDEEEAPPPQTDEELCEKAGKNCGLVNAVTNTGSVRAVNCGECTSPEACGGGGQPNVCGCTAETDQQLCNSAAFNCGAAEVVDRCGEMRQIECGTCADGETCQDNVCGCPCRIDGICYPEGASNPVDPCQRCDPSVDPAAWTAKAAGDACDDGDVCTDGDVCDDEGRCAGSPLDCSALDTACGTGVCSPASGECVARPAAAGSPCDDDGLACTSDACDGMGTCVHEPVSGRCLVDDACYLDLSSAPDNRCQICDSGSDPYGFVPAADDTLCTDPASPSCFEGRCRAGMCDEQLLENRCFIDGECRLDGERNPQNECEACDTDVATDAWSPADGLSCDDGDGLSCTVGVCGQGQCTPEILPTWCLVGTNCYQHRQRVPDLGCRVCDINKSQTELSNVPQPGACGQLLQCNCDGMGSCRNETGQLCPL